MKSKLRKSFLAIAIFVNLQISNGYSQSCQCATPPYNNIIMDWEIKIDGSVSNKPDVAFDVIPIDVDGNASTDDGYVAVGSFFIPGNPAHKEDGVVVRLDANGGIVWQNIYDVEGKKDGFKTVEEVVATGGERFLLICGS